MKLSNNTLTAAQEFNPEGSNNNEKPAAWLLFSFLTLTVFLLLQIAFLAKPVHAPDSSDIKHVNGKVLRTALIWNQKMLDAEMLVRSDDGDILIYLPSAGTMPELIKSITKNPLLSIDYYLMTYKGVSKFYAWQIAINGKSSKDYYNANLGKSELRDFDIKFITLTTLVWASLLLSILFARLGKTLITPNV